MSMPVLAPHYWTAAEVRALPEDGKRYECIDGELLVTPAPKFAHQAVVLEFALILKAYVAAQSFGTLCMSPADVEIEDEMIVQPDLFVAQGLDGSKIRNWDEIAALKLVIEVLSPGTARFDKGVKRRFYQRNGVEEYWIVDVEARLVERWTASDARPELLADELRWLPAGTSEPLRIDLTGLFARALD